MARNCGCSGSACGCLVVGAGWIDVTGTGTIADPYVVTHDIAAFAIWPFISFVDTGTVDFTVAGSGNQVSPYVVSASLKPGYGGGTKTLLASQNVSGTTPLASITDAVAARLVLTGNTTISTLPTPPANTTWELDVFVTQDATGGRTLAWPASLMTAGGTAPAIATGANARTLIKLLWDGAAWWAWTVVNGAS